MTHKEISDFLDAVTVQIRGKALKAASRDEVEAKLMDRVQEAKDTGADTETAIRAAIRSMGDPGDLGRAIANENRKQFGFSTTVMFGIFFIAFFVMMGLMTHGELLGQVKPLDFLIVVGLAIVIALIMSARHFTLAKFLNRMELGAPLGGVAYAGYMMYAGTLKNETVEAVRGNVSGFILILVYGLILFAIVNAIQKITVAPNKTFFKELFEDRLGFFR
ncbi:MAG: permease prefix domain 1-containing protein [Oscillospiraceae bacterium]|jgi:hypothetical protein|nr:permease prefix domain 1-containing protein [Oscillospiraceae bacterium]